MYIYNVARQGFGGMLWTYKFRRERRGEVLGEVGWESGVEVPFVYLDAGCTCVFPGMM